MFLVLYCADRLLVRMIRSALEDTYRIRHVATEARLEALLRSKDLLAVILDGGVAQAGEWCRRIDDGLWQLGAYEDQEVVFECFYRRSGPLSETAERRLAAYRNALILTGVSLPAVAMSSSVPTLSRAVLSTIPQGRHGCSAGRSHIHLTPAEAHLLSLLQQHAGSFVALDELRQGMWDEDAQLGRLRYHICQLRRRLAAIDERVRIETRRGTGYRLVGRGVAVW